MVSGIHRNHAEEAMLHTEPEDVTVATKEDPRYVPDGYKPDRFPRPSLAADIVLFTVLNECLKVLLVQRANHPYQGHWALPGGFADPSETVTNTARRELREETGVTEVNPSHFGIYSEPERDPRTWVVSAGFVTFINPQAVKRSPPQAGDDAHAVQWASVDELPELAFDHAKIITEALGHVQKTFLTSALMRPLFDKRCKTSEVDTLFRTVLGPDEWINGGWTGELVAICLENNNLMERFYNDDTPDDDDCVWKD